MNLGLEVKGVSSRNAEVPSNVLSKMKRWVIGLSLLVVLAGGYLAHRYRQMELYGSQLHNWGQGGAIVTLVESEKQRTGTYPSHLTAEEVPGLSREIDRGVLVVDQWGYPYYYFGEGDTFILVSFGRDGKPDELDYWKIREQNIEESICGSYDADQVLSDRGRHRFCGK